jgi:hypothetical protein
MDKIIACCGLNCALCDARIATVTNDNTLRASVAEKWKVQYHAATLTADMINCTGCREEGSKFAHCEQCEIRNCVKTRNFRTCADCSELESCSKVKSIHQYVPEALANLKSMN